MGEDRTLRVRIYGSFDVSWSDGTVVEIRGSKVRALLLMLVTSPHGSHARTMLQSTLWEGASLQQAQASLRRALSDLRIAFGSDFNALFSVDSYSISINNELIRTVGSPKSGTFLEGLSVRGKQFQKWLDARRSANRREPPARALRPANSSLPCIAVVPFQVIDEGTPDTAFAEYMTASLTRGLGQRRYFDVISHLSGRLLDARHDSMEAMREALNADFFIYGTIIEKPDSYQLRLDCADASTGHIVWSGGKQGQKAAVLEDRSQLINDLVREVSAALFNVCATYAQAVPLPDVPVPTLLLSATSLLHHPSREGFLRSKLQLDSLVARMPDNTLFRALRARWHIDSVAQQWSDNPDQDVLAAIQNSRDCMDLNPRCLNALISAGDVSVQLMGDMSAAEDHFCEANHIDPSHPDALAGLALVWAHDDQLEKAIDYAHQARRFAVSSPYRYVYFNGLAALYLQAGEFNLALHYASLTLNDYRHHLGAHCIQVQALHHLDRREEAARAARGLITRHSRLSVERYRQRQVALNAPAPESYVDALRQSGIPDGRISVVSG